MSFPTTRLRRLRQNEQLRSLVRETRLSPEAFVYPLFVCPGEGVRKEVRSMPGVFNFSIDEAVKEAGEARSLGVPAVVLFGLPETKDEMATGAWSADGIVQQAARAIKREIPELVLVGDVCLCEYTSHGHCGIVRSTGPQSLGAAVAHPPSSTGEYEIVNDATLELLARTSVSLARAGVDMVAPSDMMDGRVAAIRKALDEAGLTNISRRKKESEYSSNQLRREPCESRRRAHPSCQKEQPCRPQLGPGKPQSARATPESHRSRFRIRPWTPVDVPPPLRAIAAP